MNIIRFAVCTLAFVLTSRMAWSDQVDLTPSQDNSIFSESSAKSAGGQIGVFVGSNNMSGPPSRRGLIQFNVAAGLPAGVTITGATLILTLETGGDTSSPTISLNRLNADWGEGNAGRGTLSGGGSTANLGDATWTESKHSQTTWPAGGDFAGAASATQTVSGNTVGSQFNWSSPTLLSDVQNWYSNGSTNHGWELINSAEGTSQSVKTFYSKEFTSNSANWPKLSITYVPEPTSAGLALLASSLWLVFRRSKR